MAVINLTEREKDILAHRYDDNKRTFENVLSRDLRAWFAQMSDEIYAQLVEGDNVDFSTYLASLILILEKNYRDTGAFFSSHISRLLKETEPSGFQSEDSILAMQDERSNMDTALLLLLIPVYRNNARTQAGHIINTTKKVLNEAKIDVLSSSILGGKDLSREEFARRVTRQFIDNNKSRIKVISENEIGRIAQMSKQREAMEFTRRLQMLGITITPQKTWITVGDEKVRDAHRSANGQVRGLSELYIVGGERLEYPGDTSHGASMGNTINCRCDSVTEV